MGGFRLGSSRKDRGQPPPVPAEAPGKGQPAVEAPVATRSRVATADFGSMANPLAQSARRASKSEFAAMKGNGSPAGEITAGSYSRPGRAERPRWAIPSQAGAPALGVDQPATARWKPPAPEPAPSVASSGAPMVNGHGSTGIQPARRQPDPESSGRHPGVPANGTKVQDRQESGSQAPSEAQHTHEISQANGRAPQGAWAAGLRDESWNQDEDEERDEGHGPRILVLDRAGNFSTQLARATIDLDPAPEILRLSRSVQVIDVVEQEEPDVIVVAPEEVTGAGLKRLAEIHRKDPKIVIVLSEGTRPVTAAQTAACGTNDIIPKGSTKARLRARMVRALQTAEELRQQHLVVEERVVVRESAPASEPEREADPVRSYAPAPAPASGPAPARKPVPSTKLARVFTVASASGGCGKTFYSTNFAAYLAKATGGKVLLVDLDLQFGEVAISLHLRPKRTISELVQEEDIAAALNDYVVDHSAGYKVLCAPGTRSPVTKWALGRPPRCSRRRGLRSTT